MNAISPKVEEFKIQLEQQGRDFICLGRLPGASVVVGFVGMFRGQPVLWNMTLATLAHYRQESAVDAPQIKQETFRCPFIEIKDGVEDVYPIAVGLDLAMIDEPAIRKSIIMIRNYKRLIIGKIEFCASDT